MKSLQEAIVAAFHQPFLEHNAALLVFPHKEGGLGVLVEDEYGRRHERRIDPRHLSGADITELFDGILRDAMEPPPFYVP